MARGPTARPKARQFGPAQARHGPTGVVLVPARPDSRAVPGLLPRHEGTMGYRAFGPARHGPILIGPCLGHRWSTWAGTARPGMLVEPCRADKSWPGHDWAWAVPGRAARLAIYRFTILVAV
uniref:Uncharacterized protein n=1 Tax=Oryza alta TaxID=52545 RepID=A0A1V1H3P8_9ORYZ|nr:hypothetical protein [Oryza alta]